MHLDTIHFGNAMHTYGFNTIAFPNASQSATNSRENRASRLPGLECEFERCYQPLSSSVDCLVDSISSHSTTRSLSAYLSITTRSKMKRGFLKREAEKAARAPKQARDSNGTSAKDIVDEAGKANSKCVIEPIYAVSLTSIECSRARAEMLVANGARRTRPSRCRRWHQHPFRTPAGKDGRQRAADLRCVRVLKQCNCKHIYIVFWNGNDDVEIPVASATQSDFYHMQRMPSNRTRGDRVDQPGCRRRHARDWLAGLGRGQDYVG